MNCGSSILWLGLKDVTAIPRQVYQGLMSIRILIQYGSLNHDAMNRNPFGIRRSAALPAIGPRTILTILSQFQ
jgi:hypothetical protein